MQVHIALLRNGRFHFEKGCLAAKVTKECRSQDATAMMKEVFELVSMHHHSIKQVSMHHHSINNPSNV